MEPIPNRKASANYFSKLVLICAVILQRKTGSFEPAPLTSWVEMPAQKSKAAHLPAAFYSGLSKGDPNSLVSPNEATSWHWVFVVPGTRWGRKVSEDVATAVLGRHILNNQAWASSRNAVSAITHNRVTNYIPR
jgi:hypothetical protein